MDMKKTATALSIAAFAATTIAMPVAASSFVAGGEFQVAACGAKKRGCNPCAAKRGCNPCAAKKGCNPCAAKKGCNPCAAKKR